MLEKERLELSRQCKVGIVIGLLHCKPLSCIDAEVKRSKLEVTGLLSALLAAAGVSSGWDCHGAPKRHRPIGCSLLRLLSREGRMPTL